MKNKQFTVQQEAAINSHAPFVMCIAGPGSGKTSVLVERIRRRLSSGSLPANVAVITYTNAAAREITSRLSGVSLGYCGTLHGFAMLVLRNYGSIIGYGGRVGVIDEDAAAEMLLAKAHQLGSKTPVKDLEELKRQVITSPAKRPTVDQTVVQAYLAELRESALVDLDTILPECLRVLRTSAKIQIPFTDVLWDEVQDAAAIDWQIFNELPCSRKFAVGDPDQAIYGFRGGDVRIMLDLMNHAEAAKIKLVYLDKNFRCGPAICHAANRLIAHNVERPLKQTESAVDHDDAVVFLGASRHEREEAQSIADVIEERLHGHSVAVIARSHAIVAVVRKELEARGVPVDQPQKTGLPADWPYVRSILELVVNPDNDALAYFHLLQNNLRIGLSLEEARSAAHKVRVQAAKIGQSINQQGWNFQRAAIDDIPSILERHGASLESRTLVAKLINEIPGAKTLENLAVAAAGLQRAPAEETTGNVVACITAHAAKGREWDHVFIAGCEKEVWPGRGDAEEERRLMFVAITRARKSVRLSYSSTRESAWGKHEPEKRNPSQFIAEAMGGVA